MKHRLFQPTLCLSGDNVCVQIPYFCEKLDQQNFPSAGPWLLICCLISYFFQNEDFWRNVSTFLWENREEPQWVVAPSCLLFWFTCKFNIIVWKLSVLFILFVIKFKQWELFESSLSIFSKLIQIKAKLTKSEQAEENTNRKY